MYFYLIQLPSALHVSLAIPGGGDPGCGDPGGRDPEGCDLHEVASRMKEFFQSPSRLSDGKQNTSTPATTRVQHHHIADLSPLAPPGGVKFDGSPLAPPVGVKFDGSPLAPPVGVKFDGPPLAPPGVKPGGRKSSPCAPFRSGISSGPGTRGKLGGVGWAGVGLGYFYLFYFIHSSFV